MIQFCQQISQSTRRHQRGTFNLINLRKPGRAFVSWAWTNEGQEQKNQKPADTNLKVGRSAAWWWWDARPLDEVPAEVETRPDLEPTYKGCPGCEGSVEAASAEPNLSWASVESYIGRNNTVNGWCRIGNIVASYATELWFESRQKQKIYWSTLSARKTKIKEIRDWEIDHIVKFKYETKIWPLLMVNS